MVPKIIENSLLRIGKFSDAEYVSMFNKDKVNIYDRNCTVITVLKQEILKGWGDPESVLWIVQHVPKV